MGWKDKFHKKAKTEHVLIVVLCGNHSAHASLLQLANECDRFSAMDSHRFILSFQPMTATPQELARNTACGMALERLKKPTDTLLMIDNDMIQHGWRSLQILDTPDYDIAGGLQYMWLPRDYEEKRPPEARPCVFKKNPEGKIGQTALYPEPGESVSEVDRVGSGFMAIKRHVIANPEMLLAPGYDPPALWRNVFEPNYVRTRGLDMDFCDRAKSLGYRIKVNWKAEIGHNKTVNVNEIDEYAKKQFSYGYEIGRSHGIQMAQGRGQQAEGPGRDPGPSESSDEGVDKAGLDRGDREAAG